MAAINDLISQIQDESLRNRIQEEVNKLAKQRVLCFTVWKINLTKSRCVAIGYRHTDFSYVRPVSKYMFPRLKVPKPPGGAVLGN